MKNIGMGNGNFKPSIHKLQMENRKRFLNSDDVTEAESHMAFNIYRTGTGDDYGSIFIGVSLTLHLDPEGFFA